MAAATRDPACGGMFSRVIAHDENSIKGLPGYDDIVKPMIGKYFRGWGYWAWKPLIVLSALQSLADDEALVYLDSGLSLRCNGVNAEYARSLALISPSTGRDVTATVVGKFGDTDYLEYKWTKADTFVHYGVLHNASVTDTQQYLSGLFFLRKTPASLTLAQRWLDAYRTPHLANDDASVLPNRPGFTANRHDQSILSVLRKMHEGTVVIGDIGRWSTLARQPHPKAVERAQRRKRKGQLDLMRV